MLQFMAGNRALGALSDMLLREARLNAVRTCQSFRLRVGGAAYCGRECVPPFTPQQTVTTKPAVKFLLRLADARPCNAGAVLSAC